MKSSQTDGFSLFDAAAYMAEKEYDLTVAAMILGLDTSNFDALTIDDFVSEAKSVFKMRRQPLTTQMFGQSGIEERILNAPHLWCRKMQQKVLYKVRPDWRDHHMAKWVNSNG